MSKSEFDYLWDFHNAADTIMHSRLQAFMVTQSFLVTSFVFSFTSATNYIQEKYHFRFSIAFISIAICVLGFVMARLFKGFLISIRDGLNRLKKDLVENKGRVANASAADIYGSYLDGIAEWSYDLEKKTLSHNQETAVFMTKRVPEAFQFFWGVCTLSVIGRALASAIGKSV